MFNGMRNSLLALGLAAGLGVATLPAQAATIILSTESDAVLGGNALAFSPGDLVAYDMTTGMASLYFDGAAGFGEARNLNAVDVLQNDDIVLSVQDSGNSTIGGQVFEDGDLVRYTPSTNTAVRIFEEDLSFSGSEDIYAVDVLPNGHILLSTQGEATIGLLTFDAGTLVDFDPLTGTAVEFFDVDTLFDDDNENVDGFHLLANGHYLISTNGSARRAVDGFTGANAFLDGDIIEYDPIAGVASRFFSEALFTDDEDINALAILEETGSTPIPEPGGLALFGLGLAICRARLSQRRGA